MSEQDSIDAFPPATVAARVEAAGAAKAGLAPATAFVLAVLAGAFIALGAVFFTFTVTESSLGFGPTRLLGGMAFSLGLVLVVVAGAELFTGNNLLTIAWASGRIRLRQMLRNWVLVYAGNLVGSLLVAALVAASGVLGFAEGAVGATAAGIAAGKLELSLTEAFARGILCNLLVCLAVWLCFAGRSVTDKIFAILLPISAFVALGFEHSVANMYAIPAPMIAGLIDWDLAGFVANLAVVTLGNIVGGGIFVGLAYWFAYRRGG